MAKKLSKNTLINGTPGESRTHDTRFRKPLLYPLSYRGLKLNFRLIIPLCPFLALNWRYFSWKHPQGERHPAGL